MTQGRRRTLAWILLLVTACLLGLIFAVLESSWRNSALVGIGSCLIAVPLGTLLAFLLVRTDLPAGRLWLGLFVVLLFVPLYLQAAGWDAGFGRMGWQGGPGRDHWFTGLPAAIWIHGNASLPWVLLIVAAGLRSVNSESEEAALLVGSHWQVLQHITLHRVTGAVVLANVWVFVTTATESIITDLYMLDTFARKIFVATTGLDQGLYAAEVAFGICVISCFAALGLLLLVRMSESELSEAIRQPPRLSLGRFRFPTLLFIVCVLAVSVAMPLANLVVQAGEGSRIVGTNSIRTWSLGRFGESMLLPIQEFSKPIRWTAVIGASAATFACLAGLPLAWLARRGGIRSLPATLAILVGLAVPAPIIAQFVIWLLNRDNPPLVGWLYNRSILAPTLTVGLRGLPAVTIVLWFAFQSIGSEQLETAKMEGAGQWRRLWSVAVPQRVAALAVAWLISFAVAAGDVTATILVVPPGIETVAVRVFEMLHSGADERVAGLCLVSATCYLVIGGMIVLLAGRWINDNGAE